MKRRSFLVALVLLPSLARAEQKATPAELVTAAVENLAEIYAPRPGAEPRSFSTTLRVARAPMKELAGRSATIVYQAPDKLRLAAEVQDERYAVGRNGDEVWFHIPGKNWGVVGKPGLPKFASNPESVDVTAVPPFAFPEKAKVALLPTLCTFEEMPAETVQGIACRVVTARPTPATREAFRLPALEVDFAIPADGKLKELLPLRISARDGQKLDVAVELTGTKLETPWPSEKWSLAAEPDDKIETTAVAHFLRAAKSAMGSLGTSAEVAT